MKNFYFLMLLCCLQLTTSAQFRVHFMSGMANYKGDLHQREITLKNATQVYTLGATYRVTGHISARADLSVTKLQAFDKDNDDHALQGRNLSFQTGLFEAALMVEYDLFDMDNYLFTPYFFGGLGYFKFNPYITDTLGGKLYLQPLGTEGQGLAQYPDRKVYSLNQFNVPFGAGIKYALSDYIQIGAEFGTRKLFTDYIDDVSNGYADENILLAERGPLTAAYAFRGDELKNNPGAYPAEGTVRGNPGMNDNYYFGQIRLNIRLPWFEAGNNEGRGKLKRYSCPRF